jgi:hypothetical protein
MGAGNASSSLYKCSPNLATGGGNKKQGITSRVGLNNWENREIQTQSNGIGRFKLHFMNQLGGVEPGHSMFGGRWNRADSLLKQFYQKQLQEEIKQDEAYAVTIPLEKRFVRSSRVGSYPVNLVLIDNGNDYFEFKLVDYSGSYKIFTIGSVEFDGVDCPVCRSESIINSESISISKKPVVNNSSIKKVLIYLINNKYPEPSGNYYYEFE